MKLFIATLAGFVFSCATTSAQVTKDFKDLPRQKWKVKVGAVYGNPIIDNNVVFVASGDSSLRALDVLKGAEKWKFKMNGASRSTPAVGGSEVYVISEDGLLHKLDKQTGKVVWSFFTPQGTLGERKYDRADYYQSSPLVREGRVYVGIGDYLYAVNATTGLAEWMFHAANLVHTKPAISGEKIVFGSYDGFVYCLDIRNGTLIWKFKSVGQRFFPNGEMMGDPVITRNLVLIGSRDYNFYALEINSGYCYWNKQFPKGWALSATVLKDSVLYLGTSDDYVMIAMNPRSGIESWRAKLKYNIFGDMTLGKTVGYVGTLMGKLFCVDLKSGEIKWVFEGDGYKNNRSRYFTPEDTHLESALAKFGNFDEVLKMYSNLGAVFSSPAVTDDYVVFAGADGFVYCLGR